MAVKRRQRRIEGDRVECEAVVLGLVERCVDAGPLEWHHIEYLSNGGSDDDDNVCVVCKGCHKFIHRVNGDGAEFGRKGGLAVLKKYGRKHFVKLATLRWS